MAFYAHVLRSTNAAAPFRPRIFHLRLRKRRSGGNTCGRAKPATVHGRFQHGQRFVQRAAFLVKRSDGIHALKNNSPPRSNCYSARRRISFSQTSGIKLPTLGTIPSAPSFNPFSISAPTPMNTEKSVFPAETLEQFFQPLRVVFRIFYARESWVARQFFQPRPAGWKLSSSSACCKAATALRDRPAMPIPRQHSSGGHRHRRTRHDGIAPARKYSLPAANPSGCVSPMPGENFCFTASRGRQFVSLFGVTCSRAERTAPSPSCP